MKKFLSIAAALAMVFAMAVPALAADASVNIQGSTITTENVEIVNKEDMPAGAKLEVESVNVNELPVETKDAIVAAAKEYAEGKGEVAIVDLVEVTLTDANGVEIKSLDALPNGVLKVAVAYETKGTDTVLQVLSQNDETGEWSPVKDFTYDKATGKLEITFGHLCTVAFVVGEAPAQVPGDTGNTGNTGNQTGGNPGPRSAQTGYNTVGWIAAAMAMILCAGFCFVSARKKTNA